MTWGVFASLEFSGIHVIPLEDLRLHDCSAGCWCGPVEDDEEPGLLNHRALDGREAFERGERKPS